MPEEPVSVGDTTVSATSNDPAVSGHRAARGASVVMVGQIARIVIQIGSVAVLARLLDPVDYGLIAIVLAVVGVGEILRDFGLSAGAIQAAHLDRHQRDKLVWLNTAIGAGLALCGVLLAPVVAAIFGQPQLTGITQVLSITFLISGVTAQYRADLNRRMRFKSLVVTDVASQVIGVVIAIVLALAGTAYWALVAQQLGVAISTLVILMLYARWLPRRPRRGVDVKSIVHFGHGMMASQLVGYLNNSVDTYTIALTLGPDQLGIYNRGFQLLMRPLNQLRAPSTTVALPVLSRLNNDLPRASRYIVSGQLALGYPLVGMLAFAAGAAVPLVNLFLGSDWSAVAPVFALLAIAGAFQTLSYVGNWVYLARALTGQLFWYSLVSLSIKVVCVVVGSNWGIVGVAAGYAIAPAIAWPISLWWLSRLTPIPVRALTYGAIRITGCAVVAGLACLLVVTSLASLPLLLEIAAGALTVAAVYLLAAAVLPFIRSDLREVLLIGRKAIKR
ncbi:lipopolysaccharide biosynthesis protein [Nakamurella sp. GG22]